MKPGWLVVSAVVAVALIVALGYGLYPHKLHILSEDDPSDKPLLSASNQTPHDNAQYANDLQRLDVLASRIQQVAGVIYAVIPGGPADSSGQVGPTVSVDYALFDQLSDPAAAVMIAETIASKSRQTQVGNNTDAEILHIDETVGIYIAKAGFSDQGFVQWLEKHNRRFPKVSPVSDQARSAAFMRGYLSVVSSAKN